MAVCNGLNSHALRPGSIYTGGTFDTLMGEVTKRHLGHCNMPLLVQCSAVTRYGSIYPAGLTKLKQAAPFLTS